MNYRFSEHFPRAAACAVAVCFLPLVAHSQAARSEPAPVRPAAPPAAEAVIELSPFTVEATPDNSYGALNSNSITNFNTELEKLPISADVLTNAFMEDTNSTTLENMLREYAAGAGTGSAAGDVGGIPVNNPMDRGGGDSVSAGVQLRGLGAAVVKLDGFMPPAPAGTGLNSNFGTERVEVINGPQALLYGNGGGGGVVNIISRQARFGRRPSGSLKLQLDHYEHELAQFDYSLGNDRVAFVLSLLHQDLGDRRDNIGGPLQGVYAQLAFKVGGNTIVRLTGKQTELDRYTQQPLTLNAGNATADARHGQRIAYLLATNQMEASATGASGAGVIGNGHVNWDNVDSYGGQLRQELTTARLAQLSAETNWRPWLSTQLSVGYWEKDSKLGYGSGVTFYAPNATANPLPGEWTVAAAGSEGGAYSNQPSDSRSLRFSALATHDVFGGRGRSQTIVGVDYTKGNFANESWAYFEADENYDLVYNPDGSRIRLGNPNPYWSVSNGLVKYPSYPVGTPRITYGGKNYIIQQNNLTDPALVSPTNPQGVTGTELYIHSRAISEGAYAVNYTQWDDGRLTTLLGARYMSSDNRQYPSTAIPAKEAADKSLSFAVGANYKLASWLRPYVVVSDTYNLPGILLTVPADPFGNPAGVSHSLGEELGVKLSAFNGKLSGSVSVYALQSTTEPYAVLSQLRDSINPPGINGRHLGATGTVIPIDRKSRGLQAALTAAPSKNWRMRLSAAFVQGTIGNDTSFEPVYNDQFHVNAQGQVTYANGTVVYVHPTTTSTNPAPGTSANAGYVPLTVAKLSDPNDRYYANPDPTTGRLLSSRGRNVLNNTSAASVQANGWIKTGVTGLPISELQIAGITPADTIVTSRAGDRTTGYPELSFNFTNMYTFSSGLLKGFRAGGTVSVAWRRGDYYYYPDGYTPVARRELFSRPTEARLNAILGYERRLKRVTWSTQLNVDNVFNDYEVLIRPNAVVGYSGVNTAVFTAQPRTYTWTTTFKF